jgi:hypothetical protein
LWKKKKNARDLPAGTFLAMGRVRMPGDAEEEGRAVVVGAVFMAVVCAVEGTEEDVVLVAWGIIIGAKNG